MNVPRFTGLTSLVTGASSGIGRAIALGLAQEGAHVIGVGRSRDALRAVVVDSSHVEGRVEGLELDLTDDLAAGTLGGQLDGMASSLDILVHSAGVHVVGALASMPVEELDRMYRTHVRAPYQLNQLLIPRLESSRGQIVFVNSSVVRRAAARVGSYAASKHAVKGYADALREELNPRGIRVLSVYVGSTVGPMQEALHRAEARQYHPDRLLQPEDVAAAVLDALALPRTAEVTELDIRPMIKPDSGHTPDLADRS